MIPNLIGNTFGRLTVKRLTKRKYYSNRVWLAECVCGKELFVTTTSLTQGNTRSCGCLQSDEVRTRMTTHGHTGKGRWSDEYRSWVAMMSRCHNPNYSGYSQYGGRGIQVCDEWRRDFTAFLRDAGRRPSKAHSIDRIDNNGNYEPGNVRWATRKEQCNNTRRNRKLTLGGRTMTLAQWAEETGISYGTLKSRLVLGWNAKRALTTPVEEKFRLKVRRVRRKGRVA